MTTTHTAEGAGGQAGAAQRLRRAGRRSGAFVAFTLQAEITMLSQTSWMVWRAQRCGAERAVHLTIGSKMGSFTTGVWFGVVLALAVIALLLQQLSKASRPPAASSAAAAAGSAGDAGSASGSAAADDEQEVEATDAAALEMLLRAASRPAFLGDAELYADESGEEGSVLLRGGELREAAVAALDGVLRRADAEQTASELATADPRCLVALLQQRLRGLRRALLAGEGPAHSAAIVGAAVALDAAAAAAADAGTAAAPAAAADAPAGEQDEEPTAEARAVASALATLHGALARLPPANRRLLARLLRHLHATAASARNDSDAARLGAAYADCVFAPGTARAPAAAAALVRHYSMLRPAFSLSKAQRQRFFGATSRASRDFLARQVAAEAAGGGAGAQQEQKQKQGGAAPAAAAAAESAAWANAFAARWFGEFGASAALLRSLREDVQASLNSSAAQRPSFLLPVVARSVSLGASLPQLTNVALRRTDPAAPAPGELALSAELRYERGITFHLTVPVSVAGVTVPLAVRVQLQRLAGRLLLHLPAPHADRGAAWIAFEQPPQLELAVDLLYGEQQLRSELEGAGEQGQQGGSGSSLALATMPAIGDFIRNKVTY